MITKVKLKSWRSHLETELSFSEGTNALIGIMGSGKSLPYQEPVLVGTDKAWAKNPIGQVVERALGSAKKILTKGDKVWTTENPQGLKVWSLNPRTYKIEARPITAFIKHNSPDNLLRIKTRSGRLVNITKDHSLLLFRGGRLIVCDGTDIAPGCFVPVAQHIPFPRHAVDIEVDKLLPEFRKTSTILEGLALHGGGLSYPRAASLVGVSPDTLANWNRRGLNHKPSMIIGRNLRQALPEQLPISKEFARVAGAFLAEGHAEYKPNHSRHSVKITSNNRKYLEEVKRCLAEILPDFNCTFIRNDLQIGGQVLSALLSRLFGPRAGEKRLPGLFFTNDAVAADLLIMYFEGDGWAYHTQLACSSKSRLLLDGIQTLLCSWGIFSTIRERLIDGQIYYDLVILPKHIGKFAEHVRFFSPQKQTKLDRAVTLTASRKRWDAIDIIPDIKPLLQQLIYDYHLLARTNISMRKLAKQLRIYMDYENIGREKLIRILQSVYKRYGHKTKTFLLLEALASGDVLFDEVVEVKEIPASSDHVYDFAVAGTENFLAGLGNIVVHNSSIMDGLCFGLFGTFPALQSKKLRLDDMIMKKPKHQQAAEVVVHFEADGDEWSVRRVISRVKPTSAELRKNGQLVEGPQPSRVNEVIEKILKTSYDLFTRAIYSEQNSMDMFLTIPKGQRMKKIDELLAIDKFERARGSVVSLINRFNSALNEKRNTLSALEADPSLASLPSLKEEHELLLKERDRLEQQLAEFKRELAAVERNFAQMKERREQLIALQQELTAATALLSSLDADIDALKRDLTVEEIAYAECTDAQIKQELDSVEANEKMLKDNMGSEQRRLSDLRELAASKSAKLETIQKEKIPELKKLMEEGKRIKSLLKVKGPKKISAHIGKLRADLHRTQAIIQRAEVQIPEIEQSISELSAVGSSCPVCDQKLTEKKKQKILKDKKARISRLRAQSRRAARNAKKIEKGIAQTEKELAEARVLEAKLSTMSDLGTQLKFAHDAVKVLEREITETEKEARMVGKALQLLETEMQTVRKRAEQIRLVVRKRQELSSKIKRCKELQQKITDLRERKSAIRGFSQAELERLENARALLMSRISSIETRLSSMTGILQSKQKEIEEIEARLKLIRASRDALERLKRTSEQLSILESALLATQGQLRRNFIAAVNQAMHNIWVDLYPYRDFYSCRLDIESGDYALQLQDSTGWVPADGVASGGERALACLALRIAFALVLAPQLRWLVLDEPTHNLDSRAVEDLAAVLRDRITEFVDQVFLITHDPALEGAVSGYLYKLEREKEKDDFTRITRMAGPES